MDTVHVHEHIICIVKSSTLYSMLIKPKPTLLKMRCSQDVNILKHIHVTFAMLHILKVKEE